MDPNQPRPERLRFEEFDHHTSQSGRARVRVVLMRSEHRYTGEATGVETREGAGRTAALAALAAAEAATQGRFAAQLIGIKLVRAFDAWIVITALRAHSSERSCRLLGSSEAPRRGHRSRRRARDPGRRQPGHREVHRGLIKASPKRAARPVGDRSGRAASEGVAGG